MAIRVVDLNEEAKQVEDDPPKIEAEEAPEPTIDTANEVIEEAVEQPVEQPVEQAPETPPKPKRKAKPKASDLVNCPDCQRQMTYKNLRYSHKCSPEPPPVKKQSKPKGKAKPKPKPVPVPVYEDVYGDEEEDDNKENIPPRLSAPVKNQILKPSYQQ